MLNFLKNLFRRKPATSTSSRPTRNTKHAWANEALKHVSGVGAYIVNLPEHVDSHQACEAVRSRLIERFGVGRYKTKYLDKARVIQVTILQA